jgi:hypothetical protein
MIQLVQKNRSLLIALVLAIATAAAYWQVRNFRFVNFDDAEYVVENSQVNTGLTWQNVVWAFTRYHSCNWHPLTWISHMLDCQIFGMDARWHHCVNLALHVGSTILLFFVLTQATGAIWRSAFVAGAFALHPLHVESVAWISERKDVLSTLFWVLTMWAYLQYARKPSLRRYLVTAFVFALGLMSKPMLVTLPFVLLLMDYWPLRRLSFAEVAPGTTQPPGGSLWRRLHNPAWLALEKVPLVILAGISSVITLVVQSRTVAPLGVIALHIRVANACISYTKYIGKMFWPTRLAVLYPHPLDKIQIWPAVVAALLLVAITVLVFTTSRRYRYLAVGWFWYLGTLVPVIGLVQVGAQSMADRYTYVPLIGLFIMIAWGLSDLLAKWQYGRALLTVASPAILLALGILTWFQSAYWRDSLALFAHASATTRDNYMIDNYLGSELRRRGRTEEALVLYERAVQIDPNYARGLNSIAWLLATVDRADLRNPKKAEDYAWRACELTGFKESGYVDTLAAAYAATGRFSNAISTQELAIDLAPENRKKEMQERLELYKQRKPYIETLKPSPID